MSITNTEGYFVKYTSLVTENNLTEAFANQDRILNDFSEKISEEKSLYAYEVGKWTLRELLQHVIDTERIFAYRALAIARKDTSILPSFDENLYAANANGNARTWQSLVEEMKAVRETTKILFNSFTKDMLTTDGKFSSNNANPETLGFIIIGHLYHHIKIVAERYIVD